MIYYYQQFLYYIKATSFPLSLHHPTTPQLPPSYTIPQLAILGFSTAYIRTKKPFGCLHILRFPRIKGLSTAIAAAYSTTCIVVCLPWNHSILPVFLVSRLAFFHVRRHLVCCLRCHPRMANFPVLLLQWQPLTGVVMVGKIQRMIFPECSSNDIGTGPNDSRSLFAIVYPSSLSCGMEYVYEVYLCL